MGSFRVPVCSLGFKGWFLFGFLLFSTLDPLAANENSRQVRLPSLSLSAGDLGDETVPDVSERRATDSNTHGDWVRRARRQGDQGRMFSLAPFL